MTKTLVVALVASALTLGEPVRASTRAQQLEQEGTDAPRREKRPDHRALGLTLGALAGTILGGWASAHVAHTEGAFFGIWMLCAVGGAVGGYAAAGGFSDDLDLALDRGRDAVRSAAAGRDGSPARGGLAGLRLSSLPGFDRAPRGEDRLETARTVRLDLAPDVAAGAAGLELALAR